MRFPVRPPGLWIFLLLFLLTSSLQVWAGAINFGGGGSGSSGGGGTASLDTNATDVTVTNTTTETTLYTATIPANIIGTGQCISQQIVGTAVFNGSAQATVRVKYDTGVITLTTTPATIAATPLVIETHVCGNGATDAQLAWVFLRWGTTAPVTAQASGALAIDSTLAHPLLVSVQWGTATSAVSIVKDAALTVATSTATSANPTACGAGLFVTDWNPDGTIVCSAVSGAQVTNQPAGAIAATTTQAAITELDTEKADAAAMTTALAAKADDAATTTALAAKADASATTTALAAKADASATTTALAGKQPLDADLTTLAGKTIAGTGSDVRLSTGAFATDACVKVDASGNFASAGAACGSGTGGGGASTAAQVSTTPAGNLAALTQEATNAELDAEKQPLAVNLTALSGKTIAGNGTDVRLSSGTFAVNNCVKIDIDGNFVSAGAPCGNVLSFNARTGAVTPTVGDYTATQITNTPAGNIAAITVQAAVAELDTEKADAAGVTTNLAGKQPLDATLTALSGKTVAGTGVNVRLSTGTYASNDCVKVDSAGNLTSAGAACGTGAGGVTSFNTRAGAITPASGDYTATLITNTPAGAIAATTAQAAINELDTEKADAAATTAALALKATTSAMNTALALKADTTALTSGLAGKQPIDARLTTLSGKTIAGTGGDIRLSNGTFATDACVKVDASGNFASAGAACGAGGGSGVTSFNTRGGAVTAAFGDYTALQVTTTPGGNLSSGTVQDALTELDTEKADAAGVTTNLAGKQPLDADLTTLAGKTIAGTGANVRLSTGTFATDACVKVDAAGNFASAGAACGSGSGGSQTLQQVADQPLGRSVQNAVDAASGVRIGGQNNFVLIYDGKITFSPAGAINWDSADTYSIGFRDAAGADMLRLDETTKSATFGGQVIASNLGVEFTDSASPPPCAGGNFNIYATATALKQCVNGTLSDIGAGSQGSLTLANVVTNGRAVMDAVDAPSGVRIGGANNFVLIYDGKITFSPAGALNWDAADTFSIGFRDGAGADMLRIDETTKNTTLSGQLITSNLGVKFTDSDTNPPCVSGVYAVYADTGDHQLKKCTDGTISDLDTGGGSATTNTATSVDSELALFSGTTGKVLKRGTGTGLAKLTAGVLGVATAGTDYQVGNANLTIIAGLTPTDDTIMLGNGTLWQSKAIPDCAAAGSKLLYAAGTNTWSCGTDLDVSGGDASTTVGSSVDSELALFSGTSGKLLKRATGSGLTKIANGVLSVATSGTDYQVGDADLTAIAAIAPTDDTLLVANGTTWQSKAIPDCAAAGSKLLYTAATNAWSCGTDLDVSGGDASTGLSTSVDSELALFSGTGGKTFKRATGSGIAKITNGVLSVAVVNTDYQAGDTELGQIAALTPTDDTIMVANGTAWQSKALPDCGAVGSKLLYTAATNAWSCGTDLDVSGGDASTNTASSVDGEAVEFSGTAGKTLKRAILTASVVKMASGVKSAATQTDVAAPGFCLDAGTTDTYACNLSPAIASYVTGTHYFFKANTANTVAAPVATINLNGLGPKTIVKMAGAITTALADNDIRAGQWVECVYDGTNCQMLSQTGNAAIGTGDVTAAAAFATDNVLIRSDQTGKGVQKTGITVDDSDNMSIPGTLVVGAGGTGAATIVFTAGTAPTAAAANTIQLAAPATVTTPYDIRFPAAAGSGFMLWSNTSNVVTQSVVAGTGTGAPVLATGATNITLDTEATGNNVSVPIRPYLPVVSCAGLTATLLWDTLPTLAPTPNCTLGTTEPKLVRGVADFPDNDGEYSLQQAFILPIDWDNTKPVSVALSWRTATTFNSVVWQVQTACRGDGETDDVAWNPVTTGVSASKGTANQLNFLAINTINMTNCTPGKLFHIRIFRDHLHASDTIGTGIVVSLASVEVLYRRIY